MPVTPPGWTPLAGGLLGVACVSLGYFVGAYGLTKPIGGTIKEIKAEWHDKRNAAEKKRSDSYAGFLKDKKE